MGLESDIHSLWCLRQGKGSAFVGDGIRFQHTVFTEAFHCLFANNVGREFIKNSMETPVTVVTTITQECLWPSTYSSVGKIPSFRKRDPPIRFLAQNRRHLMWRNKQFSFDCAENHNSTTSGQPTCHGGVHWSATAPTTMKKKIELITRRLSRQKREQNTYDNKPIPTSPFRQHSKRRKLRFLELKLNFCSP